MDVSLAQGLDNRPNPTQGPIGGRVDIIPAPIDIGSQLTQIEPTAVGSIIDLSPEQ